jgi:large subunit ribosomal protein L22
MEAHAISKYVRVSPRKARIVVDMVRGKDIVAAREILNFCDRDVAEVVLKCLNSAVANAEQAGMNTDTLFINSTYVDEGPTLKRFRARAKGSASRIRKRSSHITVKVSPREEA